MHSTLLTLVVLTSIASTACGHMMMSDPVPRQYKGNPGPNGEIDYSYTAPLGVFPCKGYAAQDSVKTVNAGDQMPITLSGGAPHEGGHCQFALSYDTDKTFVVIDTVIRDCMRYANPYVRTVTIPKTAPSGKATLAWTWINAVGNREYYMACADITIKGSVNGSITGPELFIANLPGYPTIGEFSGDNLPDGRGYFNQRRIISVKNNNQAATIVSVPASTVATTTTEAVVETSIKTAVTSARIVAATVASTTQTTCTHGAMSCSTDAMTILTCVWGTLVRQAVAPGTRCSMATGSAVLIHAV